MWATQLGCLASACGRLGVALNSTLLAPALLHSGRSTAEVLTPRARAPGAVTAGGWLSIEPERRARSSVMEAARNSLSCSVCSFSPVHAHEQCNTAYSVMQQHSTCNRGMALRSTRECSSDSPLAALPDSLLLLSVCVCDSSTRSHWQEEKRATQCVETHLAPCPLAGPHPDSGRWGTPWCPQRLPL